MLKFEEKRTRMGGPGKHTSYGIRSENHEQLARRHSLVSKQPINRRLIISKANTKIVEPIDDDPKPKLYRVDWEDKKKKKSHRYIAAIDKTIALTLFDKKYGHKIDVANLSINRVPSEWHVRWPVMWDRIGIVIEETRQEEIAAFRNKEREDSNRYKEWHKSWVNFWEVLSDSQADDYNMWIELQKVKYTDWINEFAEMWADIGANKWENRSMFNYLEID